MKTKRILTFVTSLVTTAVFATGILAARIGSIAPANADEHIPKQAQAGINLTGSHGFDFLVGDWRVHHRRISAVSKKWVEFDGTCSLRLLMNGSANIEEHALDSPDGAYRAIGLRSFDQKTGKWSIWWLDSRYLAGPLDPPAQGSFENGVGRFYADYEQDGKKMIGRLQWSDITATSAHWEQASSADGGKTWATNWIMDLTRLNGAPKSERAAAGLPGSHDFAFLEGAWRVGHRYIRVQPDGQEWAQAQGTCEHHELYNGWANVEDYVINSSSGANHAVALRSYNPNTGQWTIWWLDGRAPSEIPTPMQGRFENGVGTFFGSTTLNDKPVRVRFTWSDTASASPRWQQAYSYDDGKTWETVWVMEFQRGA